MYNIVEYIHLMLHLDENDSWKEVTGVNGKESYNTAFCALKWGIF